MAWGTQIIRPLITILRLLGFILGGWDLYRALSGANRVFTGLPSQITVTTYTFDRVLRNLYFYGGTLYSGKVLRLYLQGVNPCLVDFTYLSIKC